MYLIITMLNIKSGSTTNCSYVLQRKQLSGQALSTSLVKLCCLMFLLNDASVVQFLVA